MGPSQFHWEIAGLFWRATMQQQFLRRPAVEAITGLGRSTIYQMMSDGRFPKSVRIGRRAVAWTAEEVQAWLEQRISERSGDLQGDRNGNS